jgi:hypothetical protein
VFQTSDISELQHQIRVHGAGVKVAELQGFGVLEIILKLATLNLCNFEFDIRERLRTAGNVGWNLCELIVNLRAEGWHGQSSNSGATCFAGRSRADEISVKRGFAEKSLWARV